jgi:uncharacterized membrane-anchored protein YitT (DUF2179 family)
MPNEPPLKSEQSLATPTSAASLALGLSKTQIVIALAIAGLSDVISAFVTMAPPISWGVDLATAVLLFVVLGWRWLLLPGLVLEAIPGVGVFPIWVLVVVAIAVWGTARPKLRSRIESPRRP